MKIHTSCNECAMDRDIGDHPEALYVDLTDDWIITATCSMGHKLAFALQQQKFEVLLEMGAMALLDGYYREAVATFAAAQERFLEFFIRAVCYAREVSGSAFDGAWKAVSSQSERQLGAFIFLYLLLEGAPPPLKDTTKFRNDVIHKGAFRDAVGECDLLSLVLEFERLHPSPPGMGPCPRFVGLAQPAPEQMLDQPMLRTTLIGLGSGTLAHQIAQSLML